jgi:GT2 family glycosyltransferase
MPSDSLPDSVRRLLEERSRARQDRDWARADALRDELAGLGWEPQDAAHGSTARPILVTDAVPGPPDRLDEGASGPVSVVLVAEDYPDDVRRTLRGLEAHRPTVPVEVVVVANAPSFALDDVLADGALPSLAPLVVAAPERLGWADAATLGLTRAGGAVVILLDTSVEPVGDIVTPLLAAFDDPSVGLAGGWGVTSRDAREFDDAPPGEVDAVEGYLLAIRREALQAVRGFDRRYRFYRNADLDLSFAVRDAGWRAVRTDPLPAVRHEHRGWSGVTDEERDRLSRRNFYRFLDRWRDRPDLLLASRRDRAAHEP